MRRARFVDPAGSIRVGELDGDSVEAAGTTYGLDDVRLLPPVTPSKVLGIGRNYRAETTDEPRPDRPEIWYKGGEHVVAGPDATVAIPDTGQVTYEAELGVVIGAECRAVSGAEARDAIAGFTCVDDVSDQRAKGEKTFFRRKSFDNAAPMGPAVASPDGVPANPRVRLWVNGEKQQDSAGEELLLSPAEAVATFSDYVTLKPEDVIIMGTPSGSDTLSDGDSVRIEIEGVGRLEHSVSTR